MQPCAVCRKRPRDSHCGMKIFVTAECPVCLESVSPMVALPCGHLVCAEDFTRLGGKLKSASEEREEPDDREHDGFSPASSISLVGSPIAYPDDMPDEFALSESYSPLSPLSVVPSPVTVTAPSPVSPQDVMEGMETPVMDPAQGTPLSSPSTPSPTSMRGWSEQVEAYSSPRSFSESPQDFSSPRGLASDLSPASWRSPASPGASSGSHSDADVLRFPRPIHTPMVTGSASPISTPTMSASSSPRLPPQFEEVSDGASPVSRADAEDGASPVSSPSLRPAPGRSCPEEYCGWSDEECIDPWRYRFRHTMDNDDVLSQLSCTSSAYSHSENVESVAHTAWRHASSAATPSPMSPVVALPWVHDPAVDSRARSLSCPSEDEWTSGRASVPSEESYGEVDGLVAESDRSGLQQEDVEQDDEDYCELKMPPDSEEDDGHDTEPSQEDDEEYVDEHETCKAEKDAETDTAADFAEDVHEAEAPEEDKLFSRGDQEARGYGWHN